jgi:fibronectin type 3 domain-containing protein
MKLKRDLPSKLIDETLIISGFPEGTAVSISVYDSAEAVTTQAALESAMTNQIATASGSGSQLELKNTGNQAFTQTGTFLVVVTVNGEIRFKDQVSFDGGGAAFSYGDLQKKNDLPQDETPEPPEQPEPPPGSKYAKEYWGEWIRIDNGDTWYISGNSILVNGNVSSIDPALKRQSAQVISFDSGGSVPSYLFASRTANATLRGKVILMNNAPSGSGRQVSVGIGSLPPLLVKNPKQPEDPPVEVQPDPYTGEIEVSGIIPGDEIEVEPAFPDTVLPPMIIQPLPVPPPDPAYQPPVVPIPVVSEGVNLKVSLRPQNDSEDTTRIYADGTSVSFYLDVENIGTEDCIAAIYELVYDNSALVINDPAPNRRLGTLEPKGKGGVFKKTIPLTVTGKPLPGNLVYRDVEIKVNINDTIAQKTWNDAVSIRYNREKIPFRIRSEYPVQGIIKVPGGKTHHFKTNGSSYGNYAYTVNLPWSTSDYIVVFSGADASTETVYSLGINTAASTDFSAFEDLAIYEGNGGNNEEARAVRIENRTSIMAYLHKADIDYYRINLGNEIPVVKLVPMESYAFLASGGNGDNVVNPGESAYLDLVARNETPQSRGVTVNVSASGANAAYVSFDKAGASIASLPSQYSASLTDTPKASSDGVNMFVNYRLTEALKLSVSPDCPPGTSIPLALSFSDTLGMNWSETISLTVMEPDRSIGIKTPVADNCVLREDGGNGDGQANPGERLYYDITIANSGTGSVSGLRGVLSTTASNSGITLNTASVNLGTLDPGASAVATFRFSVSTSCPPGTELPFQLTLTAGNGIIWETTPPAITVKLAAPLGLKAPSAAIDRIDLSWNTVPEAIGYQVYCAESETGTYTPLGTPTESGVTAYTHEELPSGTSYYYKVSALGINDEESALSASVSGSTRSLGIPANLQAEVVSMDCIKVTWDPVSDASNYRLYYALSGGGSYNPVKTGYGYGSYGQMFMHMYLPSGTTYYYKVAALDGYGGKSADSEHISATTPALDIPENVQAEARSVDSITVTWDPVSWASGYRLYYGASPWATGASIDVGSDTSYTHTGLSSGTQYYYRAVSLDGYGGKSDDSYPVSAVTYFPFNGFNEWVDNDELGYGTIHYYRFNAAAGTSYTINWNDLDNSEKTGNINISAYREDGGETWFTNADSDGGGLTHTASSAGYYLLEVVAATTGSYALRIVNNASAISGFSLASTAGTINEQEKTIAVLVPYNTNLASLTPTLTLASGALSYSPSGAQNFSSPRVYRVTMDGNTTQAYTVTVTRKGQGGITINPPSNSDVSIAGFPTAPFTVSRSGSVKTHTITISDTGYSNHRWYVDDAQKTADSGSDGRAFTINAARCTIGSHTVTLMVYKDGAPWSNEVTFTVTN